MLTFLRHYAEMVAAMLLGMFVLGSILAALLSVVGIDVMDWPDDAPALALLGMAFTMSVPMAAWMRYRRHAWAPTCEMVAAMFVPSLAAVALLAAGLVEDMDVLFAIQHIAMFPSMLIAMLLRRGEYSGRPVPAYRVAK